MNYNFGSKGTLILKALNTFSLNGRTFEMNEPVLILNEAEVSIEYQGGNTNITQGKNNLLSYQDLKPTIISVPYRSIDNDIINFITKEVAESAAITSVEKQVSINDQISVDNDIYSFCFVYDENNNKVEIDGFNSNIIVGDFIDDTLYTVVYEYLDEGYINYCLDKPEFPYFSLEFNGVGNINNKTSEIIISASKIKFFGIPKIVMNNNSNMYTSLSFYIITTDKDDKVLMRVK